MTPFEMSCYELASRLHLTLGQVKAMSWDEYAGWCEYLNERDKEDNPSMLDSPSAMLEGFKVLM